MDVKKKISGFIDTKDVSRIGAIAQLVEHSAWHAGGHGSSPLGSIQNYKSFNAIDKHFAKALLALSK